MAVAVAVVAADGGLFGLDFLLGAVPGDMAHLLAVEATRTVVENRLASIGKSLHVLLERLGPGFELLGTISLGREAIADAPLLAEVALKIHEEHGGKHDTLHSNDPDLQVLLAECVLELDVGHVGMMLEKLWENILELNGIAVHDGFLDLSPNFLLRDIRNVTAIDLAALILASGRQVTCKCC